MSAYEKAVEAGAQLIKETAPAGNPESSHFLQLSRDMLRLNGWKFKSNPVSQRVVNIVWRCKKTHEMFDQTYDVCRGCISVNVVARPSDLTSSQDSHMRPYLTCLDWMHGAGNDYNLQRSLRCVELRTITNPDTIAVIEQIGLITNIEQHPGHIFLPNGENEFLALVGTPDARAIGRMLIDYMDELNMKLFESIQVFCGGTTSRQPSRGFKSYSMTLNLRDIPM